MKIKPCCEIENDPRRGWVTFPDPENHSLANFFFNYRVDRAYSVDYFFFGSRKKEKKVGELLRFWSEVGDKFSLLVSVLRKFLGGHFLTHMVG